MQLIRRAVDLLIEAGLLDWGRVTSLQSLSPNVDFNKVALDSQVAYERVYLAGLSLRYYNLILEDQSYLQFSISQGVSRFAYYPNPFTDPNGLLELLEDPVDFNLFDISELEATAGRSPLRFDLAPGQYVALRHPYAHFHLGHGELGRLASRRVFCPLTFSMLVVRLYYPSAWSGFDFDSADLNGFTNKLDAKFSAELTNNGEVSSAYFTRSESKVAHLK